ncbi:hypothetical protein V8J36_00235 [Frigidibacter sp. MR17.14]|uniref:hypothetical protein n=1 Tax=Frigidibacter sp. MR17.14 TaxID=3126509 RepID=UPI003012A08A
MALIRIDLAPDGQLPAPAAARLRAALTAVPRGPVVALLHGFRFSPRSEALSPHRHILALDPAPGDRRALSWPRALGFGQGRPDEGLAIAIGWEASGSLWRAWQAAGRAGTGLAQIAARLDGRPLDILAHSMGARVAFAGIAAAPAGSIGRVLLLAAAEFTANAMRAVDSPAGRRAGFVNVTTRENDLFDAALELALGASLWRGLGRGLPQAPRDWVDLDLDCAETRAGLAALGFRIGAARHRVCHWGPYLRPGVFALYRAILRERAAISPAQLRAAAPPATVRRFRGLIAALPPRDEDAGPRMA